MTGIDSGNTAIFPKTQKPQRQQRLSRQYCSPSSLLALEKIMTTTISAFLTALGSESSPGKLDAPEDNEAHGCRSEHPHGAVNIVGRRALKRNVGGSVVGTKKEEKQNFHVRFLHTCSHNHLILFTCLSSPSLVLLRASSA
ncbi:hypothetical protein [Mesorhizobium sp. B1-1-8]|uniref:hypothetical protein n=1 Tax=Mesorhizobium sp. B1-1-8 TaxID=2589976 RepID=UPI001127F94D|nr:hypothetical protein [Mesorhizobium sp. B1-1-8]UCI05639.1 hypothetical protein FJ974_17535 [Mesorhizobium sp. B1-1-8]